MAKRSKSSQGRANVRAVFAGHQSSKRKLLSFHKARRLFQQKPAIRRCRFVTRELDQVAPVQKIFEQRFLVRRKRRRFRQGGKKFVTNQYALTVTRQTSVEFLTALAKSSPFSA